MAGMSFKNCKVERSTNGTNWDDIRAYANSVQVSGGERQIGKFFNFSLDVPELVAGKRESLQVTTRCLFTEGAGDTPEVARAAYEAATPYYTRWSPAGGASGDFLYTTDPGIVINPVYPQGEASSPDPITLEVVIETAKITKSVIT